MNMKGRRISPDAEGKMWLAPGDYGYDKGQWWCRPPGDEFHMGNLANHQITEHEDGTITVSPSILIRYDGADGHKEWHGFLEHGVWRQC